MLSLPSGRSRGAQYSDVVMATYGGRHGQGWKKLSALRDSGRTRCAGPAETGEDSDFQARLGATIGVVCALGLIVWLMALLVR